MSGILRNSPQCCILVGVASRKERRAANTTKLRLGVQSLALEHHSSSAWASSRAFTDWGAEAKFSRSPFMSERMVRIGLDNDNSPEGTSSNGSPVGPNLI